MRFYRIVYKLIQNYCPSLRISCLLVIFSAMTSLSDLQAQEVPFVFRGEYPINDSLVGQAVYSYRLDQQDTVKNGPFTFQRFIERYDEIDSVKGIVYQGNFADNLKDGAWQYGAKELTISGAATARESRIVYEASGGEFLVNTNFNAGKAHGFHELVTREIIDSEPTDTSFYVRLQYEEGHVGGHLTGFTNHMNVEGQFDGEGFPNGDWVFNHQVEDGRTIQEIRHFDHGLFSRHYYKTEDELLEIKRIGFDTLTQSGLGLLTRLPADSAYFRALDYTDVVMDTETLAKVEDFGGAQRYLSRANAFLQRVFMGPADHLGKNVWASLEGSDSIPPISVKISKFTFSDEEIFLNKENNKVLRETKSLITHFFDDPNTQVGKYADSELGYYYQVLEIYNERLDLLSPLITFLADQASEYVDHKAILQHKAADIVYPDTVVYEFQDEVAQRHYVFPPDLTTFSIAHINEHLTMVLEDVSSAISQMEETIEEYQAESNLKIAQGELVLLRDSVFYLFSHVDTSLQYNALHGKLRESVQANVESAFKSFSAMDPYHRILAVDSLKVCFQHFSRLYYQLVSQQDRLDELDREYTRSVWNPYTFTYMEERVKERLYTAFEEILFPYLWDEFESNLTCGDLPTGLQRIDGLLDRMAELRLQDTRELERSIRKSQKDPEAYLSLLGLKGEQSSQHTSRRND